MSTHVGKVSAAAASVSKSRTPSPRTTNNVPPVSVRRTGLEPQLRSHISCDLRDTSQVVSESTSHKAYENGAREGQGLSALWHSSAAGPSESH